MSSINLSSLGDRLGSLSPRTSRLEDSALKPSGLGARGIVMIIEAPGKIPALRKILSDEGLDARLIATGGHFMKHPASLFPCGLRYDKALGKLYEPGRLLTQRAMDEFLPPLIHAVRSGREVVIATDADPEGDVIAEDIRDLLSQLRSQTGSVPVPLRIRLNGLSRSAVRSAMANATPLLKTTSRQSAAAGRARAVADRLISSTWTRPGSPVGRVMTPLINALATGRSGQPYGEVRFRAKATDGGRPFIATLPLYAPDMDGNYPPDALIDIDQDRAATLAGNLEGKLVSGSVSRIADAGAAVVTRFGNGPCYSIADALIAASRLSGIPVQRAERALQRLYQRGEISYPRTSERALTSESAAMCSAIARRMGIAGFDAESELVVQDGGPANHEGLHPTPDTDDERSLQKAARKITAATPSKAALQSAPGPERDNFDEDALYALVSRRAIEAGLDRTLQRGIWKPDEETIESDDLDEDDIDILASLDWYRESGRDLPWSRLGDTGVSIWPIDGQIVHAASLIGLGRASTYATHAHYIVDGGFIEASPGGFPTITARGRAALAAAPDELLDPATSIAIEQAIDALGAKLWHNETEDSAGGEGTLEVMPLSVMTWDTMLGRFLEDAIRRMNQIGASVVSRELMQALENAPLLKIDEGLGQRLYHTIRAATFEGASISAPILPDIHPGDLLVGRHSRTSTELHSIDELLHKLTAAKTLLETVAVTQLPPDPDLDAIQKAAMATLEHDATSNLGSIDDPADEYRKITFYSLDLRNYPDSHVRSKKTVFAAISENPAIARTELVGLICPGIIWVGPQFRNRGLARHLALRATFHQPDAIIDHLSNGLPRVGEIKGQVLLSIRSEALDLFESVLQNPNALRAPRDHIASESKTSTLASIDRVMANDPEHERESVTPAEASPK